MRPNQQKRVLIQTTTEVTNVVPWSGGNHPHHLDAEDIVAVLLDNGEWVVIRTKDINWKHYTQQQAPGWLNIVAYGTPEVCVADMCIARSWA